jgi:hypothetical protein
MPGLVPHVSQGSAIRFVHIFPHGLAMTVIGLADIHRDGTGVMSGHDLFIGDQLLTIWIEGLDIFHKTKLESVLRIRFTIDHAQADLEQIIQSAAFGTLHPVPALMISRFTQIRNDFIQPAGQAEFMRIRFG